MIEKICESSNVYPFDMMFSKINEIIGALNAMECKPETATNTRIIKLLSKLKLSIESGSETPIMEGSWFHDEINAVLAQLYNA